MKRLQFSGVAVLLMLLAVVAYAQTNGQPERFTANAVSTSPEYGTGQRIVEITVDRWSPNAERERLVAAPADQRIRRAAQAAAEEQAGRTHPDARLARYDLRYAQQTALPEGGRMVVIATDRPIGFWEATQRPRSFDYPFTVIQMKLDREGTGRARSRTRRASRRTKTT
jgi:hypothetical protein